MALTIPQLHTLVDTNLADNSNIIPAEHREVEHEIINYMATSGTGSGGGTNGSLTYTKILYINSWTVDKQYTITTGIPSGTLLGVYLNLECTSSNNGFSVGDIITAPTPYPEDSGRTSAQGIGVQWKANVPTIIHLSTNDGVLSMSAWVSDGSLGNTYDVGANSSSWKIRVTVLYSN